MNNMEMQYPQIVQDVIVESNDTAIKELVKNHKTAYGILACALEQNSEEIDKAINNIASFFASQKALEITKEYEDNCTKYERWIKNDPIKLKQMDNRRSAETNITSTLIQAGTKGTVYGVKKVLSKLEEKEVKRSLWNLCVQFANELSNDGLNSTSMNARLFHIHNQLLQKKMFRRKDANNYIDLQPSSGSVFIPSNSIESFKSAHLLYLIYKSAHNMSLYKSTDYDKKDFNKLIEYWEYLGVWGTQQKQMLYKMDQLDKGNADEFDRMNNLTQSFYTNLIISVPNIDHTIAKNINRELLKYVPNGDKQLAVRKAGKVVTKAAIIAASGIAGTTTSNPILLNTAATAATSLLSDLQNTEVIGKCLNESGIDDTSIKRCIEEAKRKQLSQR